jgi:hypothetical protein
VTQNNGRRIERLLTFLSRERAQTKPDNTVMLSVISGSCVLAFTKVSGSAVTVLPMTDLSGLVRLFF